MVSWGDPGQKYESHVDTDPTHDVQRPMTMLMYLSDVESGGETVLLDPFLQTCYNLCACFLHVPFRFQCAALPRFEGVGAKCIQAPPG